MYTVSLRARNIIFLMIIFSYLLVCSVPYAFSGILVLGNCGSSYAQRLGLRDSFGGADFSNCCAQHDDCYDKCGNTQDFCDNSFGSCLHYKCDHAYNHIAHVFQLRGCKETANTYHSAVHRMGGDAYREAQKEKACGASGEQPPRREVPHDEIFGSIPPPLTWTIKNATGSQIWYRFYWPDWRHDDTHSLYDGQKWTFNIECKKGENICYGAWSQDGGVWGVGKGDRGCAKCCFTCGSGKVSKRLIP
ncbi:MAG: hypothetical protein HQL06_07430 [Nitrospirae bacterium]|nr:hypothetical protein [Nitrospirota bacterium]